MKRVGIIVICIVGVLLLALGSYIGISVYSDLKIEGQLKTEIDSITAMLDDFENLDYDELEDKLTNYVTTGDYYEVERAIKTYLSDVFDCIYDIVYIMYDDTTSLLLSADNYISDGPDFILTKSYIKNNREDLLSLKGELESYFEQATIDSYLNENIDSYYRDIYNDLMYLDASVKKDISDISNSIDEFIDLFNSIDKVIDFLIANKSEWTMVGEYIYFSTDELYAQYEALISEI